MQINTHASVGDAADPVRAADSLTQHRPPHYRGSQQPADAMAETKICLCLEPDPQAQPLFLWPPFRPSRQRFLANLRRIWLGHVRYEH